MITGNDIRRNARKTPPERVFLTPEGGLPLGNYPKEELIEYVRRNIDQSAELAALRGQADRLAVLAKAAQDLLKKCDESPFVEDPLSMTVFYDDADCDGFCLMEDIEDALADYREASQ